MFRVSIRVSKTDQCRVDTTIILASTGSDLCLVLTKLDYFRPSGNAPGPLFVHPNHQPLCRHTFVERVLQALAAAGVTGTQFNGNSFCIRAATSVSATGVPEMAIKLLSQWESAAYQLYIRPTLEDLVSVSKLLVQLSTYTPLLSAVQEHVYRLCYIDCS